MILTSLAIENFGLYAGRTIFDLAPTCAADGSKRPVVLIGGQNGAGKTTFLEAIRLALYGVRALGTRVGRQEYESYIAKRIHRPPFGEPAQTGAVEIDFDYAEAGHVHHYAVRREWAFQGERIQETLRLEKDGKPVEAVPSSEWHSFLQELVPPGVSQLFFFDGEKIQDIADLAHDGGQLVEAIRSLLGIELITSLRTDLGLYLARHRRGGARGAAQGGEPIQEIGRELDAVEAEIELKQGEVAELVTLRESQARTVEQVRRRFNQEGGELAARRASLEADRDNLRRRLGEAETELRTLAGGLLPFAIAPRLAARLEAHIERLLTADAVGTQGLTVLADRLADVVATWRVGAIPSPRSGKWNGLHWEDLDRLIGHLRGMDGGEHALDQPHAAEADPIAVDAGDLRSLRNRLIEAKVATAPKAVQLGAELEELTTALDKAESLLSQANGKATSVLLDELTAAEAQLSATSTRLAAEEERLRAVRVQLKQLHRKRDAIAAEDASRATLERQTALAGRVGAALADYESRLMRHKVSRLEGEFARCFRDLARKHDLVSKVTIDPETFDVHLIGQDGVEIPKSSLSAGERQIYAISMLWALARASGRALPAIVDTPLARLDTEHRWRLVERYFPRASHQTILLSTDTEIEADLLKRLRPYISHAYRLEYQPLEGRTIAREGYFGTGSTSLPGGSVRALRQA